MAHKVQSEINLLFPAAGTAVVILFGETQDAEIRLETVNGALRVSDSKGVMAEAKGVPPGVMKRLTECADIRVLAYLPDEPLDALKRKMDGPGLNGVFHKTR